jgi:hypothetical protein
VGGAQAAALQCFYKISHKETKTQSMDRGLEEIARHAIDGALKIHTKLGPGLLESVL